MYSLMIVWLPIIIIRAFIFGRWSIYLDVLLAVLGLTCIFYTTGLDVNFSWQYLPFYLVLGGGLFITSSIITLSNPINYLQTVLHSTASARQGIHIQIIYTSLVTAFLEECAWRVIYQTVLGLTIGLPTAVVVVAFSFTLLHRYSTEGFSLQFCELLIFSLSLGILFALTHDLLVVVVVHAIRNYFIGIQRAVSNAH